MKKITLIALLISVFALGACARGKQPVAFENVPQVVQTEMQKTYAPNQIQYITFQKELGRKIYTFVLGEGTKVKYDHKGILRKVDNKGGINETLVPEVIMEYVRKTFLNATITEYKYERSCQEVELNNSIELVFNKRGKFLRIED